jgi:hypothetical protein
MRVSGAFLGKLPGQVSVEKSLFGGARIFCFAICGDKEFVSNTRSKLVKLQMLLPGTSGDKPTEIDERVPSQTDESQQDKCESTI